jgi:hypothetical protein
VERIAGVRLRNFETQSSAGEIASPEVLFRRVPAPADSPDAIAAQRACGLQTSSSSGSRRTMFRQVQNSPQQRGQSQKNALTHAGSANCRSIRCGRIRRSAAGAATIRPTQGIRRSHCRLEEYRGQPLWFLTSCRTPLDHEFAPRWRPPGFVFGLAPPLGQAPFPESYS